mgnify:CR=1 FL=1
MKFLTACFLFVWGAPLGLAASQSLGIASSPSFVTKSKSRVANGRRGVIQPQAAPVDLSLTPEADLKSLDLAMIQGKLREVGADQFAEVVVTTKQNYDVYLVFQSPEERQRARSFLGKQVVVTGPFKTQKMLGPNEVFLHMRYSMVVTGMK